MFNLIKRLDVESLLDEAYQEGQKDKMYEAVVLADTKIKEARNEAIEECAKIAEEFEPDEKSDGVLYASQKIRSLKEK